MLPALIAGFLGRMVVGEAAATATGARVAAAAAGADATAAGKLTKDLVKSQGIFSTAAMKAADDFRRMAQDAKTLGKAADEAEAGVKGLQTQTQMMTIAAMRGEKAAGGFTGHFVGMLDKMASTVDHLAAPVASFVALANPAKAAQFELTMRNAHAVVGRELIPMMDAFTRTAQKVGDVMAGFEPVFEPAIKAVADMVDEIGTDLVKAAIECEPELKLLAIAIEQVARTAAVGSYLLLRGLEFSRHPFGRDEETNPKGRFGFDPTRSSRGAAAQEARFVGAKTVADEAIKMALTIGATTQDKQLTTLESIDRNIAKLAEDKAGGDQAKPGLLPGGRGGDADGGVARQFEQANRRNQTHWGRPQGK